MSPASGAGAPTALVAEANRPRNGAVLTKRGSGRGEFTVDNTASAKDAVVTLAQRDQAVMVLYVRAGATATATKIPDGTFAVFSEQGQNWDPASERFTGPTSSGRFARQAVFSTERTNEGITYSTLKITLHAVPNGNTRVLPVAESSIPN